MISRTNTTINRTMDDNNINQIIPGEALTVLKKLPDSFIHVCITSPPYWNQRWYGDDPNIMITAFSILFQVVRHFLSGSSSIPLIFEFKRIWSHTKMPIKLSTTVKKLVSLPN